ncbi:MAG: DUF4389 domain-containing protein [Endozoicomonas sp. (ex Botrylloides leachii)]|nr:DUF4389 domain-containing protein [Endozoicomonas sp. (ex Botrylloides leachii)]
MNENVINNLKSESRWLRLLFMVVFYFAAYVVGMLLFLVAIIQVIHGFIKGSPNNRLLALSAGLNRYFYQVLQYITYNCNRKPYPFSDWPEGEASVDDKGDKLS